MPREMPSIEPPDTLDRGPTLHIHHTHEHRVTHRVSQRQVWYGREQGWSVGCKSQGKQPLSHVQTMPWIAWEGTDSLPQPCPRKLTHEAHSQHC